MKKVVLPLSIDLIHKYKSGDFVEISGDIIVARDQAHKRIFDSVKSGGISEIMLKNQIIFFAGPSPARPGKVIGSIGPTTSSRMEKYIPFMSEQGVTGFIGKGQLSKETLDKIKNKSIYFVTFGGFAALLSKYIIKSRILAYEDLGAESILRLTVSNFPAVVY
ncbi:fumarate hydratase C-terminal domain-containing protein [Candidatus Dependentiae bacterium]|nr:fumarate hydratase C-terminal domain-containing protein [Candidatus Dependentiae bacterium]